jgi:hypothetical protein
MLRPLRLAPLLLPLALLACDKKADDKKVDDKAAKADDKQADDKADDKPVDKPKKLEQPWERSAIAAAMKPGTTLTYKQTGKDIKGKDVTDDFKCVVKTATANDVSVLCDGVNHPSEDKGAKEAPTLSWTELSPFWAVEQPQMELKSRADLTVPAGTFDTVEIDVKGFFGDDYTFWLIADKPGIYAKVHKRANTTTEGDQTDMIFELAALPE